MLRLLGELIAGSPHNLVSRRDRGDVLGLHLRECAALAGVLPAGVGERWIDIGTGGGLPGLVLALCRPDTGWTLLDATLKKAEAVRCFASTLGLENVQVLHGRAEELAHQQGMRGQFNGAVTRAVGPLPVVMELSRGFVASGGTIAAVRGRRHATEVEASHRAAHLLHIRDIQTVQVQSTAREAWLVTMHADGPTPSQYPRKTGFRTKPL
ncbi:MAG: 16S rRNA (guanine(527)-N(7))-methyltransferase RsmG [Egibacteraceae bacterium]